MACEPTSPALHPNQGERRRGFPVRRQLRSLAPLAFVWAAGLALLAVAGAQRATPVDMLFLDPTHLTGAPWYTGAVSNLGILVWACGAAFAISGAWVARRIGRVSAFRFLSVGAFATVVLVLDDAFRFHAGPLRALLGGSKPVAQLAVVTPVLVWAVVFWADIKRTRLLILAASLAAFVGSVLVDLIVVEQRGDRLLLEDGLKFLGVIAWSQYFAVTSRDIAASAIAGALQRTAVPRAAGVERATVDVPVG